MFGMKREKERIGKYIKRDGSIIFINPNNTNRYYNRGYCDGVRDGLKAISKAPAVDAIEIPENSTYGDMIMKVIESAGNYDQNESNGLMYIHEVGTPSDYCVAAVNKKLWNTPFKRGREE